MKRWILMLCTAALLLLFAGCDQSPDNAAASNQSDAGRSSGASSNGSDSETPSEPSDGGFTVLGSGRLKCATEDGYYYLTYEGPRMKDGVFAGHMMYVDYKTRKEIYLCNRPGCAHDTAECPALFLEKDADPAGSLFVYDNSLFVFSHEQDQDGTSFEQGGDEKSPMQEGGSSLSGSPACLYRMNLDGTGREQVYAFAADLWVEDIVLAGDRSLYFVIKKLASGQADNKTGYVTSTERTLIEVDTDSWKSSAVCTLEPDWKIIGAFDDALVVSQIVFDRELTEQERFDEDTYLDAYRNSQTHISTFRPSDGSTELLVKLRNQNLNTSAVRDGALYVSSQGEGRVNRIDLKTKEESVLAETQAGQILSAYRDVLLCGTWDGTDRAQYFIHLRDGTIDRSDLTVSVMETPIEILAEMQDAFLVISDIDAELDTAYDNGQYSIYGYQYALIAKEDLYQGRANYQPIDLIGTGM
ncbi:hypothetical protein [Candidatus Soleaferrea massiliensis]|uniref:hypothetical protein n=1 Tax=Candidatus Soleaferrea massiliensis TaxID=1470354 RepID=UPI00058F452B|nr:hypothetical protein [Candidatus Soleaferrea massiliensis]